MGTRGVIRVFDCIEEGAAPVELVTIYRQFDGYPEGLGLDLRRIVDGRRVFNGIPGGVDEGEIANGMGCLAATIVVRLKGAKCGSVYLYPQGQEDCGQEYEYHVIHKGEVVRGSERPAEVVGFHCAGGYGGVPRSRATSGRARSRPSRR